MEMGPQRHRREVALWRSEGQTARVPMWEGRARHCCARGLEARRTEVAESAMPIPSTVVCCAVLCCDVLCCDKL